MNQPDTFEAIGYEFANRIWLAKLFGKFRFLAHIRIAAFSFFPFIAGSIVAYSFGFLPQFLHNWAIYYGTFGIYLTTAAIWHGNKAQYDIYDRFFPCFDFTDDERLSLLRNTLESYSDTRRQIRSIVLVCLVAFVIGVIGFWSVEIDKGLGKSRLATLFQFEDFQTAGWYGADFRWVAFAVTMLFAFWAALPLGTAYRLMRQMPRILSACEEKGSPLFPRFIKMHFEPLASFYTRISFLWSVGTILFLVLFRHNNNWLFFGCAAFLALVGGINFVVPQLVYSRVAHEAERSWLAQLEGQLRQFLVADAALKNLVQVSSTPITPIDSYYLTHERWVYPIHDTYIIAFAQIMPMVIPLIPYIRTNN